MALVTRPYYLAGMPIVRMAEIIQEIRDTFGDDVWMIRGNIGDPVIWTSTDDGDLDPDGTMLADIDMSGESWADWSGNE